MLLHEKFQMLRLHDPPSMLTTYGLHVIAVRLSSVTGGEWFFVGGLTIMLPNPLGCSHNRKPDP